MSEKLLKVRNARQERGTDGHRALRITLLGGRSLCRSCLRTLLEQLPDSAEVIEAEDFATMLDLATNGQKSDVVLYSVLCPREDDLSALKDLSQALSGTPIVVHTDSENPAFLGSLIDQGVAGIIPTSSSADVALAALHLVAAGGTYIPSHILQGALKTARDSGLPEASRNHRNLLTARETEVFELIAKGLRNKAVAQQLGLAEPTVKIHVRNIFKKLNVKNRAQVAHVAPQFKAQQKAARTPPKNNDDAQPRPAGVNKSPSKGS